MSQLVRKLSASSPSKHELRKLLQGMLNHERVAEVHVLLAMLCDAGLPVDVVMFNLLMTGYKKRRQWQAAQLVMSKMVACGLQPDAVSYNILIDACGPVGEGDFRTTTPHLIHFIIIILDAWSLARG